MQNRDLLVNDYALEEPVVLEASNEIEEQDEFLEPAKLDDPIAFESSETLESSDNASDLENEEPVKLRAETLEEKNTSDGPDINNIFKMANNNVKEATNIINRSMEI